MVWVAIFSHEDYPHTIIIGIGHLIKWFSFIWNPSIDAAGAVGYFLAWALCPVSMQVMLAGTCKKCVVLQQ